MKKCFICFEELGENYVKLCSCEESYIHLRECYENFRCLNEIKCPICKKELFIEERFYYDWFYLFELIKKIFLILYIPFIFFIFPILYSIILAQNKSNHFSIFLSFIFGNFFILIFYYNLFNNKYSKIYPNDNFIESNSKRLLEEVNIKNKLIYFFKCYIIYYTIMLITGIIIDKSVQHNFLSFIILISCIFTLPTIFLIYKLTNFVIFRILPYLFKYFCISIGVLKRKPYLIKHRINTSDFE